MGNAMLFPLMIVTARLLPGPTEAASDVNSIHRRLTPLSRPGRVEGQIVAARACACRLAAPCLPLCRKGESTMPETDHCGRKPRPRYAFRIVDSVYNGATASVNWSAPSALEKNMVGSGAAKRSCWSTTAVRTTASPFVAVS
jgi:hypothetical protein